jgi:hypothetical protein
MLLLCGKESNSLTAQMISATFFQLNDLIGSEIEPTLLTPLLQTFASSVKILGGPAVLPLETHEGLVESLTRSLENITEKRKNRPPIPDVLPAINFDLPDFGVASLDTVKSNIAMLSSLQQFDISSQDPDEVTEDMETFALIEMATLLSYLDPMHPLLANVTAVKSLGRNRGIKWSDDLIKSSEALTDELMARFGPVENREGRGGEL